MKSVTMKFKKILSFVLMFCFAAFALVGLTACGENSVDKLSSNYEKMAQMYGEYSSIFTTGECDGLSTDYLVSYGDRINAQVSAEKSGGQTYGYLELETKYNKIFAISSKYIDDHKNYLIALAEQEENSKEVVKSLENVNKSLNAYSDAFTAFVEERNDIVDRFRRMSGSVTDNTALAYIRRLKKEYGNLVEKNLAISTSIAQVIESTGVFDLMKEAGMTEENAATIRDYIGIKMLPIYSDLLISKIENQVYWEATKETADKTRVENLILKAENSFESYINNFVTSSAALQELNAAEVVLFLDMIAEFFDEVSAYNKALDGFDFAKMAGTYENDLAAYKKKNALAEVYLQKMEQFFGVSVGNFMTGVNDYIY